MLGEWTEPGHQILKLLLPRNPWQGDGFEIVTRSQTFGTFKPESRRWVVERTFAWLGSGWRDENSTGWPALTHNPPIAPPIWPEPMMPMRSLPPLACARIGSGRSAARKANAPLAPSSARREWSKHSCFRI